LSFDHTVTSSIIIILKIEVSLRLQFSNPKKGPNSKSEENDPPLSKGWVRACRATSVIGRPYFNAKHGAKMHTDFHKI